MRAVAAVSSGLFLAFALVAGAAFAHHDGAGNLPPSNPHSAGIPQFAWEEGTESLSILDEYGNPTGIPVVLNREPMDLEHGNLWFLMRIGGEDGEYVAGRFEGFLPTGDLLFEAERHFNTDEFFNPAAGVPLTSEDYVYIQDFPHAHSVVNRPRPEWSDAIFTGLSSNKP